MKFIALLFLLLFVGSFASAQASTKPSADVLFAQGMFTIQDAEEIASLELSIRNNPNANIVRLDSYSKRFFIMTKNISSLTETDLRSWFGAYGDDLDCIQIGVHGIDAIEPYPFTNCSSVH